MTPPKAVPSTVALIAPVVGELVTRREVSVGALAEKALVKVGEDLRVTVATTEMTESREIDVPLSTRQETEIQTEASAAEVPARALAVMSLWPESLPTSVREIEPVLGPLVPTLEETLTLSADTTFVKLPTVQATADTATALPYPFAAGDFTVIAENVVQDEETAAVPPNIAEGERPPTLMPRMVNETLAVVGLLDRTTEDTDTSDVTALVKEPKSEEAVTTEVPIAMAVGATFAVTAEVEVQTEEWHDVFANR